MSVNDLTPSVLGSRMGARFATQEKVLGDLQPFQTYVVSANEPKEMACKLNIRVVTAILFDEVDALEAKSPNRISLSWGETMF